ncbi:DIM1-domain-containing protein [Conidiobolus coronatus NRRL 28638]|uniref:Spliceosomal protein DIB1 n=1 Tax=Conidiobolus coronatus (strain ATCC 28846 / CBS 209.66 / NRRL 28638) TaxID=796925 RepID=A0A137PIW7_CONC2|nr:DIM1-domain-containing protein [Conidiobolus coronatus NRRL 28638]|eukprot:KXN74944.1 DIM1-domain-containing protein [Conidiobolus coronatus NRRL 28638]
MNILPSLNTKIEIDQKILTTLDKVLVLRFGKCNSIDTQKQDNILEKSHKLVSKFAEIYTIESDNCPEYIEYFEIYTLPTTIFFFNSNHLRIDFGTLDNTKFVGNFQIKQDFIDLVEVLYRGGKRGKVMFNSPIPRERVRGVDLLYKGY